MFKVETASPVERSEPKIKIKIHHSTYQEGRPKMNEGEQRHSKTDL
jgi:hypothetical protein